MTEEVKVAAERDAWIDCRWVSLSDKRLPREQQSLGARLVRVDSVEHVLPAGSVLP
jgi:hypothetical protein